MEKATIVTVLMGTAMSALREALRVIKPGGAFAFQDMFRQKQVYGDMEEIRSESRQVFAISEEELKRIDAIIAPLVKQGQSIHHICIENADDIIRIVHNLTFGVKFTFAKNKR